MNRRDFLQTSAAAVIAAASSSCSTISGSRPDDLIIDTHQHLWDQTRLSPPWLKGAPEVLRHNYRSREYAEAIRGLNVKAIYMEVDVAPQDHVREADEIVAVCRAHNTATVAATIGGRPASHDFENYIKAYSGNPFVKGVRQVLHSPSTPSGFCLSTEFVRGVQTLGKYGLNFELTMRPTELRDAAKLIRLCPDTRFVLDHCGNGDPKAFNAKLAPGLERACLPGGWKRGIDSVAALPGVMCKISGIVASLPPGSWSAEDLAPVVNHCLDAFGPDRVFFGGDWPVCLLGSPLRDWVEALRVIVASRSAVDQRKLWSGNATRFYRI
jgi:L-fuconolactonase